MQTATEQILVTTENVPGDAKGPFTITPMGLQVNGKPTFDEWYAFGHQLKGIRSALQWAIGDWINLGEDCAEWGDKYTQAMNDFDFDFGYLRNMASIARQFPRHARVTNLSWSHHQAVAVLPKPEQKKVLAKAAKQNLSREDVRVEVKAIKLKLNPPVTPPVPPPLPVPEPVVVPQFQPPPVAVSGAPVVAAAAVRITGTHSRTVFFEFEDETLVQQLYKLWHDNKGKDLVLTLTRKDKP